MSRLRRGPDMTRRDRQRECNKRGLPWELGKSFDHSAPCGPIHPAAQVGHLRSGTLSLAVNGRCDRTPLLEKMIWNVHEIVSELSVQYRLLPGDLIFTGTPEGVGAVQRGDRLSGRIEGLAPCRSRLSESPANGAHREHTMKPLERISYSAISERPVWRVV